MLFLGGLTEGDNLAVGELAFVDGDSHECALVLPSLFPGSSWVDVEEVQRLVVLDFEDVRMSADEEMWRSLMNLP